MLWPNLFWVSAPCPAQGIVCFYARISNTPSSQSQNNCWRMTRTICKLTWTNKCHHFSNCFLKEFKKWFEKWLCQGFWKGLLWDVKKPWCPLGICVLKKYETHLTQNCKRVEKDKWKQWKAEVLLAAKVLWQKKRSVGYTVLCIKEKIPPIDLLLSKLLWPYK